MEKNLHGILSCVEIKLKETEISIYYFFLNNHQRIIICDLTEIKIKI